jgi:hypothetical protein
MDTNMKRLISALVLVLGLVGIVSAQTAHLSWQDMSHNETSFGVEAAAGPQNFQFVTSVPQDVTFFAHDVSHLVGGTIITYRVYAENLAGKGYGPSVKFVVPFQQTPPPPVVTIPNAPGAIGLTWVCPPGKQYDAAKNACI